MVTMSVVPGRLRVQCGELRGRPLLCRQIESRLAGLSAVLEARASHRTGRVLVVYRVAGTDHARLMREIDLAISSPELAELPPSPGAPHQRARRADPFSTQDTSFGFGDFARQAAVLGVASLLPAPWSALLPMTAEFIRRDG